MAEGHFEDAREQKVIFGTQSWAPSHIKDQHFGNETSLEQPKNNTPWRYQMDYLSNLKGISSHHNHATMQNLLSQPIHGAEDPVT